MCKQFMIDKKLFWIEGATRGFDGYDYLGERPDLMLEWFAATWGLRSIE